MAVWLTVQAQRVLYVTYGQDIIACDRGHSGLTTLLLMLDETMRAELQTELARGTIDNWPRDPR